jgi:hypothetical protein
MGKGQWNDEVIKKLTWQIINYLYDNGHIVRALNEPVSAIPKVELLKGLGFDGGEVPQWVWARVRKASKKMRLHGDRVYLIGGGGGFYLGTKEHAALHAGSRAKENETRELNLGAEIAATDRGVLREQQRHLDKVGKGRSLRRLPGVLQALGADEESHLILAALPAPKEMGGGE